jgi:AraC-like DNA-binding protein
MHLVVALQGELRVRGPSSAAFTVAHGVFTSADVEHAVDASGAEVLVVFVDPESEQGLMLEARFGGSLELFDERTVRSLDLPPSPRDLMGPQGAVWLADWARRLGAAPVARQRVIDPRVKRALRLLKEAGVEDDMSLGRVAVEIGLSPSRLMHLFTASVGLPIRPYMRWVRLQRAAHALALGRTVTEAAAEAGFSDSAHLSRAFRRAFGMRPSDMAATLRGDPNGVW